LKAGSGSRQVTKGNLKQEKAIIKTSMLLFNSDKSANHKDFNTV